MNVSLLKYMDRKVLVDGKIYDVAGINWENDHLLLLGNGNPIWVSASQCQLIPEDEYLDSSMDIGMY